MKVVILSKRRVFSKYVVDNITRKYDVVGIILEKRNKFNNIINNIKKHNYSKLFVEITDFLISKVKNDYVHQKKFFNVDNDKLEREELVSEVYDINGKESFERIKKLNPDIIVVYGTSILKSHIINFPELGVINLHIGLLPYYRGVTPNFWALYNKQPEKIGLTIHYINERIDAGGVIVRAQPEITPKDNFLSIECKCIKLGTQLLLKTLDKIEKGAVRVSEQRVINKYYPLKKKTVLKEIKLAFQMRAIMENINIKQKILWSNGKPIN